MLPTPKPSTGLLADDPEVKLIQVLATQVSDWNNILRRAVEVVIQLVQQQTFPQELNAKQRSLHGDIIPSSSPLFCLDPILDGGLLRVGERLQNQPSVKN